MMNGADAAYTVLQEAGKPLHYTDIARCAIQSKLWSTSGKTPAQTINSYINQEIMHRGKVARFVRLGNGMYAAAPQAAAKDSKISPMDLAIVSGTRAGLDISREATPVERLNSVIRRPEGLPAEIVPLAKAWDRLPPLTRQRILGIVRSSMAGEDDPVIVDVIAGGVRQFPKDFLNGDDPPSEEVLLPEEEIKTRHVSVGTYVVQSQFGFRRVVRNETDGKYLIYAHKAGERTVKLPHEMLRVFKTVKAYEQYLEQLWHEFRNAYGRQCGSPYTARRLADEVFERLGLPAIVVKPPVPERDSHPDNTARRVARGARTPPVAFYLPLLQVLNELGGAGRANQVAELVGRKMQASLNDVDFKPLPSSGVPRWRNTVCWARDSMVRNGLLKSDSRKGIWEISQEGRDYLERYRR